MQCALASRVRLICLGRLSSFFEGRLILQNILRFFRHLPKLDAGNFLVDIIVKVEERGRQHVVLVHAVCLEVRIFLSRRLLKVIKLIKLNLSIFEALYILLIMVNDVLNFFLGSLFENPFGVHVLARELGRDEGIKHTFILEELEMMPWRFELDGQFFALF